MIRTTAMRVGLIASTTLFALAHFTLGQPVLLSPLWTASQGPKRILPENAYMNTFLSRLTGGPSHSRRQRLGRS